MNTIYIINTSFSENAFLLGKIGARAYSDVVLGKKKYTESLLEHLDICNSNILFTNRKIATWKDLYRSLGDVLLPQGDLSEINLFYYSARFFPVGSKMIKFAIKKVVAISEKTFFRNQCLDKVNEPSIFSVPYSDVIKHKDSDELLIIDLKKDAIMVDLPQRMLDLEDSTDSILLFNENIDKRYFNSISVDSDYYFVKKSSKLEKMQAEHNFLSNLPVEVKPFFPQVGTLNKTRDSLSYQIEKVCSFDAAVLLRNGAFKNEKIFADFLGRIQDYFDAVPKKKIVKSIYNQELVSLFVDKVLDRVRETKKLKEISRFNILAKLEGFISYNDFCNQLIYYVQKLLDKKNGHLLHFSHGDLCASNIMYDITAKQLKLIDPRGWNNSINETYRPELYDFCKLSHSFLGNYDYIMSDMFVLEIEQNGISLHFNKPESSDRVVVSLFTQFVERNGIDIKELRLLEATLFLSMIPLHKDSLAHMSAQLVQAMHLYKKGMKWQ